MSERINTTAPARQNDLLPAPFNVVQDGDHDGSGLVGAHARGHEEFIPPTSTHAQMHGIQPGRFFDPSSPFNIPFLSPTFLSENGGLVISSTTTTTTTASAQSNSTPPNGNTDTILPTPSIPNPYFSRSSTAYTRPNLSPHPALSPQQPLLSSHGSMILYRLAADADPTQPSPKPSANHLAQSPNIPSSHRNSSASFVLSADSKYPSKFSTMLGGQHSHINSMSLTPHQGLLVPYAYDPSLDEQEPPDEEDMLHDPNEKTGKLANGKYSYFPWRGIANVLVLAALITALLSLFVFYPVWEHFMNGGVRQLIEENAHINRTGQAPVLFQMPDLVDADTPDNARTRVGFDGLEYDLVFSDEFNVPERSFYPGDDPYWEAVDLWYGATQDLEWYDPSQVTTRDGALVITMDSADTLQSRLTPGSTAPFTSDQNHGLPYRSGMLQSWNKFCFTSGYIEVSVILPGPDENTQGYWPGAWTMGNLARPGYPATTDGTWPYTYNECDVGTLPNQTWANKTGPAAALFSENSRSRYNNELSWLNGQRLSACSCPGSDHPGPTHDRGRGAPEIDIFEANKDKNYPTGHVVSQSAQFAPFSHDYLFNASSADRWRAWDYPPDDIPDTDTDGGTGKGQGTIPRTRRNTYSGSAVQQSVSGVTRLPHDMFQGLDGRTFRTLGFEYWADPGKPEDGFINWQVDSRQSHRVSARAVGPDMGARGSQVGQRLIPLEPMSIVLNLGMSNNWQTIDLSTMMFPAEFLIDYVRVYQRRDAINYGCDPVEFPTRDYIERHMEAYQNVNMTEWPWEKPQNSLLKTC